MPKSLPTFTVIALLSSFSIVAPTIAEGFNVDRARENLRALLEGRKQFQQLTLAEQREVTELDALLRRKPNRQQETRQSCREREGRADPSPLESQILDLKCSQRPE